MPASCPNKTKHVHLYCRYLTRPSRKADNYLLRYTSICVYAARLLILNEHGRYSNNHPSVTCDNKGPTMVYAVTRVYIYQMTLQQRETILPVSQLYGAKCQRDQSATIVISNALL